MGFQTVFKRYEIKYMITREQKEIILDAMKPYMEPDKFGRSTIRNIYYDTDDYILARHSIAKPDFKEKLRIRSYQKVSPDDTVFVELKRKYDHVVYKRRVALPEREVMMWTSSQSKHATAALSDSAASESLVTTTSSKSVGTRLANSQMTAEIDYFLNFYQSLRPAAFLSYEREAYKVKSVETRCDNVPGKTTGAASTPSDFRVTFDENVLFRDYDLTLCSEVYGDRILDEDCILMELKCSGGIPMWMTSVLSELHIYKTSFSKYGTAYQKFIFPELKASYGHAVRKTIEDKSRSRVGIRTERTARHAIPALTAC